MKNNMSALILSGLLFPLYSLAQEKSPWTNESEVAVVNVGGNTQSESYSAKQKSSYKFDLNTLTGSGRYLQTEAGVVETAKSWDAALKFERELSDKWSLFVQHGAESNVYAGYTQRDNSDFGGKYFFTKTEPETFFGEVGLRSSQMLTSGVTTSSTSGRLYLEYAKKLTEATSGKLWIEYLPNFKDSAAYLTNYEPSLSVVLSKIFSLKISYLVKVHNKTVLPTEKKEDTTFMTSIVAKF